METSKKLECKYIKVFPILLLLCSFVILWSSLLVGFSLNTITGIIILLLGLLTLTRPILVVTPNTLEWKNLFGKTIRTVPFKLEEIEIKENKIFVSGEKMTGLWMFNVNADTVQNHINSVG